MSFVYILRGSNKRFYIGSTNNFERRIIEHKSGKSKYTKRILPIELVFKQKFENFTQARRIERWLKRQKDTDLIKRIIRDGKIRKIFNGGPA